MSPALRRSGGIAGSALESHDPLMNWIELDRIGARDHGPEHVIEIGHIDVVVAYHDILRRIGRAAALRGNVGGLHRVARIALCDRHGMQHAGAADFVTPHLIDARHAGVDHVLLDDGRAHHGAVARHLVRSRAHRRHAQQDRIVAMIDRLDVDHRHLAHAARIVTGPFAERALRVFLVGRDKAFEHDLRVGREREAGHLAAHHPGRSPAHAADDVELEHAVGGFDAAIEESNRIAADHHGDRHRLAALEIFLAVDPAVMALRHDEADGLLVVHLRAVGAGVEPVLLGVDGDAVGAGADIAAAVLLMPDRRGELGDVDVIAHHDVLKNRSALDHLMRNDFGILEIGLAIGVGELPFGQVIRKSEGQVAPLAGEHVEQHAEALRAAGHVLEHDAGAVLGAQDGLGGEPDILLPGCAAHDLHLTKPLRERDPLAQVVIGDVRGEVAADGHGFCFPL